MYQLRSRKVLLLSLETPIPLQVARGSDDVGWAPSPLPASDINKATQE